MMNVIRKLLSNKVCLTGGLIAVAMIFMFAGCAAPPKPFDPGIKGPQMLVEPEVFSVGVVSMLHTPIVFKGKGFDPEDSVFITLLNVKKGDKFVHVPIADGEVDKNGFFTAQVGTLVKVSELLNAKLGSNKKMETAVIVSKPPIAPGTYTARAVSMESDKIAVCKLVIEAPWGLDDFKDWVGKKKGKIVEK
jgi:hypothetical protein